MAGWNQDAVKQFMQVVVSLIVLVTAVILVFGGYPDDHKKWAFGMVGVVVGYWLR